MKKIFICIYRIILDVKKAKFTWSMIIPEILRSFPNKPTCKRVFYIVSRDYVSGPLWMFVFYPIRAEPRGAETCSQVCYRHFPMAKEPVAGEGLFNCNP